MKASHCFYHLVYKLAFSIWGFMVFKDQDYLPVALGGTGDYTKCLTSLVYPYPKHAKGLKEYFLYSTGYHVGSLISLIYEKRRNDFLEMGLHHVVTLYLYGGGYLTNIWESAGVVSYLHDIADILTNLVRILSETNNKKTTAALFIIYMAVWFWTRLFVFPIMIYQIEIYAPYMDKEGILVHVFAYLLCCLFVLHVNWFYMFSKILKKFTDTGVAEDTINKINTPKKDADK